LYVEWLVAYGAFMRFVFNFSLPVDNRTRMDTRAVRKFVDCHNHTVKLINHRMRSHTSWTVIEMLELCESLLQGIEQCAGAVKDWCRQFWHMNKPILWLFRIYSLGTITLNSIERGTVGTIPGEFTMPGFQICFESDIQFKEYSFSHTDAVRYIEELVITIPQLPEIRAIHEGIDCEEYEWGSECSLCSKKQYAIKERRKELIAQSNNIFVNNKLRQKVFQAFLEAVQMNTLPAAFHAAIKRWNILPILDVLCYAPDGKRILTDAADIIKHVDSLITSTFTPGNTPRQITEAWIDKIITHYYYFAAHYTLHQFHDPLFNDYELFYKVYYRIYAMELLVTSQRDCVKMIRDMF